MKQLLLYPYRLIATPVAISLLLILVITEAVSRTLILIGKLTHDYLSGTIKDTLGGLAAIDKRLTTRKG